MVRVAIQRVSQAVLGVLAVIVFAVLMVFVAFEVLLHWISPRLLAKLDSAFTWAYRKAFPSRYRFDPHDTREYWQRLEDGDA